MYQLGNSPNNKIASFIGMIIFVVLVVVAFVFLSYLFVIIAALTAILVLIAYIRMRFFKKPMIPGNVFIKTTIIDYRDDKPQGRIIEQDEEK